MKQPRLLYILFVLILISWTKSTFAQRWKYSLGWSVNYTYGRIDDDIMLHPNAYSMLKSEAGLSVNWPLSKEITGLSAAENILRLGIFTLGVERRVNNRWSMISGFEIGGRLVNYKEYAQDGTPNGKSEEYLANIARRSFLVCSIPLLIKYKLYQKRLDYSLVGGVYLNEAFSQSTVTPFYTTPSAYLFYPTFSIGFKVSSVKTRGFAFECAYQQGLSEAISDQITVGSSYVVGQPLRVVSATSNGSHFRVGVSYNLSFDRNQKKKETARIVPYNERERGQMIKVKTLSDTFQICFEDYKTADRDSIRIVFNNSREAQMLELGDSAKCIGFEVYRQLASTIDIYAINEGQIKPNTMCIRYVDSKKQKKVIILKNGMEKYIRIKVIYLK